MSQHSFANEISALQRSKNLSSEIMHVSGSDDICQEHSLYVEEGIAVIAVRESVMKGALMEVCSFLLTQLQ